jgi:nitrite reductase (NO-forming)
MRASKTPDHRKFQKDDVMETQLDPDRAEPVDLPRRGFLTATALGTFGAAAALRLGAASGPALAQDTASPVALGIATEDVEIAALARVRQIMVAPPFLPEHEQIASTSPRIIEVKITCAKS